MCVLQVLNELLSSAASVLFLSLSLSIPLSFLPLICLCILSFHHLFFYVLPAWPAGLSHVSCQEGPVAGEGGEGAAAEGPAAGGAAPEARAAAGQDREEEVRPGGEAEAKAGEEQGEPRHLGALKMDHRGAKDLCSPRLDTCPGFSSDILPYLICP